MTSSVRCCSFIVQSSWIGQGAIDHAVLFRVSYAVPIIIYVYLVCCMKVSFTKVAAFPSSIFQYLSQNCSVSDEVDLSSILPIKSHCEHFWYMNSPLCCHSWVPKHMEWGWSSYVIWQSQGQLNTSSLRSGTLYSNQETQPEPNPIPHTSSTQWANKLKLF